RWILSVITRGNPYLMSQQAMGLALWQRSRFGCSGFLQCCLGAEFLGIAMPKFRHALHPFGCCRVIPQPGLASEVKGKPESVVGRKVGNAGFCPEQERRIFKPLFKPGN